MATLDLSLNALTLPGLENFDNEFGTKLPTGQSVSTEGVCNDVMLPFQKRRPIVVNEDSDTSLIEYDANIVVNGLCSTVTLAQATYNMCKVNIRNTRTQEINVKMEKGDGTILNMGVVPVGVQKEYTYNGETYDYDVYDGTKSIEYDFGNDRWLRFDFNVANKKTLLIKGGTSLRLDIEDSEGNKSYRNFSVSQDTSYDLTSNIATSANASSVRTGETNGRDFYVYLVPTETSVGIVCSLFKTSPSDIDVNYTENNTRRIGSFHTECASISLANAGSRKFAVATGSCAVGDNYLVKQYTDNDADFKDHYTLEVLTVTEYGKADVITVPHNLVGWNAGDILPESVFCLTFKPHSEPEGMIYDVDTDKCYDIYMQSGTGQKTASVYKGIKTDARQQQNHADDMRQVRKNLLTDSEFTSCAVGSNEGTNIAGSAEKDLTGGWTDTAGQRMVSFLGAEDCCGLVYQWLDEVAPVGGSGWSSLDGIDVLGQGYGDPYVLLSGGYWDTGSDCGSRCRDTHTRRSDATSRIGGRGSSRVVRNS